MIQYILLNRVMRFDTMDVGEIIIDTLIIVNPASQT